MTISCRQSRTPSFAPTPSTNYTNHKGGESHGRTTHGQPKHGQEPRPTNRKKLIAIIAAAVLVLGGGGTAAALAIKADNEYKAETAAICASALEERTLATENVKKTLGDTQVQAVRAESPIELENVETTSTIFAEKDATDTSKSGEEYVRAMTSAYSKVEAMTVLDECTSRDQAETITGQNDELKAAGTAARIGDRLT